MLSGEENAFEEFFGSYFPGLYRFALSRLNQDRDAAEEVVQIALSKAITKLGTYRAEAALFTWLCTFCRHEISRYFKRENRVEPLLFRETPEIQAALESLFVATDMQPDQVLLQTEITEMVQIALNAIPSRYADALEWKYIEDLPVKDIALRLNLGLKAAESLLTRARQSFRDAFLSVCSGVVPVKG
ncbi:MAG TPA: sigma-70 family RNA polymerase sigma factor [Acidobacteriota bacterium]|nr:sigma-70 family RNA polymerase sigma factor [Acidobacteriota bacterium]